MTMQLPDLFPGFDEQLIDTSGATIHARIGGKGPPLLLLHGYPQTHVMWHRLAGDLAKRFTLIIPDLRGYGASSCPQPDAEHFVYSKRAMANDMVELMDALGYGDFRVAGHDRGGRVAYRMALDYPDKVNRLCVLDIVPTYDMWHGLDMNLAMNTYHWMFLAQPHPLPERLISAAPDYYFTHTLASWTAEKTTAAFDGRALRHYLAMAAEPARIRALCEDYRAGATYDLRADEEDRAAGKKITCPVLAIWGETGIAAKARSPLQNWTHWADDVTGHAVASGHFVCEESPDSVLEKLVSFMRK